MNEFMVDFAITGVGGLVAPRHLAAITAVGGKLTAALDPNDSVGILDRYALDTAFFTDTPAFVRHLTEHPPRYLSVCSPNDVHERQCRIGLEVGADVICEKPAVLDTAHLDVLAELEQAKGRRIFTVLQLRYHERLAALREKVRASGRTHDVVLTYVTPRGRWYDASWKGNIERSGGLATNIGVHIFDLLVWLFGPSVRTGVHLQHPRRMAGFVELERARVAWFLSVEPNDLPSAARTYRVLTVDGETIDFAEGFEELHRRVYEDVLAGRGVGLADARPSIELAAAVRFASPIRPVEMVHPCLRL